MALTILALAIVACAGPAAGSGPLHLYSSVEDRTLNVEWRADLPSGAEVFLVVWHEADHTALNDSRELRVGMSSVSQQFDLRAWPAGRIHVELTFKPWAQTDLSVLAEVGESGEHLTGPQVKTDSDSQRYVATEQVVDLP
ncbi:MAG: hypothetical protein FIA92_02900 [Chloroflexi bacterium]|nr:hypothetical protein [Chloroflexota bacterium]